MRRVYALLGLVRRYGSTRLTEVCTVALAADMLDVQRLRRMLEHGLATPLPAPPARTLPRARYPVPRTNTLVTTGFAGLAWILSSLPSWHAFGGRTCWSC